uniref:Transmembrane protein n=1 Tax=Anopheles farauti TaxID=69004 RepID=A0A182QXH1_9DIPT
MCSIAPRTSRGKLPNRCEMSEWLEENTEDAEWISEYDHPALPARVFGTFNFPLQVSLFLTVLTTVCYAIVMVLGVIRFSLHWERVVVYEQLILSALGLLFDFMALLVMTLTHNLPGQLMIVSGCTIASRICLGAMFMVWMYRRVCLYEELNTMAGLMQPQTVRPNNSPQNVPEEPGTSSGTMGRTLRRNMDRWFRTHTMADIELPADPESQTTVI